MSSEGTASGKPWWREIGQRLRLLAVTILVAGFLVAILVFIFVIEADVPGSEVQVQGTVTGLHGSQSSDDLVAHTRFIVQLDDGRVVVVRETEHRVFRMGKRVVVFEETSRILGWKTYRFADYLEEKEAPFR